MLPLACSASQGLTAPQTVCDDAYFLRCMGGGAGSGQISGRVAAVIKTENQVGTQIVQAPKQILVLLTISIN